MKFEENNLWMLIDKPGVELFFGIFCRPRHDKTDSFCTSLQVSKMSW